MTDLTDEQWEVTNLHDTKTGWRAAGLATFASRPLRIVASAETIIKISHIHTLFKRL